MSIKKVITKHQGDAVSLLLMKEKYEAWKAEGSPTKFFRPPPEIQGAIRELKAHGMLNHQGDFEFVCNARGKKDKLAEREAITKIITAQSEERYKNRITDLVGLKTL